MSRPHERGDGWHTFELAGEAWIRFTSRPDVQTLEELRKFAQWDHEQRAWRSHADHLARLAAVGRVSVIWESIGESAYDRYYSPEDYTVFHQ